MPASQYAFVASGSSMQITTARGVLDRVIGGSGSITLYDTNNGTTTGTEIGTVTLPGGGGAAEPNSVAYDVVFENGLYAVAGSGTGITVAYS